jgi:hypothetical protein
MTGISDPGITIQDFIGIYPEAMKGISDELGL